MKLIFSYLRLAFAALGIAAVVSTFFDTLTRGAVNPFNFFGFFTMQSNIIFIVALALVGAFGLSSHVKPLWLDLFHGCSTTYIVIVGIVYNTLLVGLEGGISLVWANSVLHVIIPIYALADWLLLSDRAALAWKRLWVVVVYPLVWLAVVLVRGATDGWVPYPFLDPANGYGIVAVYGVAIAVATLLVAWGVWGISRVRAFATM